MKFIRQDAHKKKRLAKVWRKPRGGDSKLRLRMQRRRVVSPGYGTKKSEITEVASLDDAKKVKSGQAVIVAKIGFKKRKPVLEALIEKNAKILNIIDPKKYIESKEKALKSRKKQKSEKKSQKTEEKSIEETVSEEEKKKTEKEEIDKLLTKRV